jgi:hypothetical protein
VASQQVGFIPNGLLQKGKLAGFVLSDWNLFSAIAFKKQVGPSTQARSSFPDK